MTARATETEESGEVSAGAAPATPDPPAERLYRDAVEEYLEAAEWLGPADAPLKVHARAIAGSLDRQLARSGEVQSALASSFDKVLLRLDRRRPPPSPAAPGLGDRGPMGEQSIFTVELE